MSDTKFTAGPWSVSFDGAVEESLVMAAHIQDLYEPWNIATVHGFVNDPDEAPANAALIAAAPDLYAALEALLSKLEEPVVDAADYTDRLASLQISGEQALSKARGDIPSHPSDKIDNSDLIRKVRGE